MFNSARPTQNSAASMKRQRNASRLQCFDRPRERGIHATSDLLLCAPRQAKPSALPLVLQRPIARINRARIQCIKHSS
jgi:hypothetical protein